MRAGARSSWRRRASISAWCRRCWAPLPLRAELLGLRCTAVREFGVFAGWCSQAGGCCAVIRSPPAVLTPSASSACFAPTLAARSTNDPRQRDPSAFSPLISLFEQILVGVHSVIGGSWGWAIIGLTLIVRFVTLPLTLRQFKSMARMRQHAPELKKIQESYKDDKRRQQEETMKYYKEVGFNPLSSCLPLYSSCRSSSRWSTCCGRTSRSTSAARR